MKERDLSKLKRSELLEIMLAQSEEIDRLQRKVTELEKQVQSREITLNQAGNIAQASLALTAVFVEAQKAAELYLENVRRIAAVPEKPSVAQQPKKPAPQAAKPAAAAPAQRPAPQAAKPTAAAPAQKPPQRTARPAAPVLVQRYGQNPGMPVSQETAKKKPQES